MAFGLSGLSAFLTADELRHLFHELYTFLGLPSDYVTEDDREGVGLEFYAAILEKPTAATKEASR